MCERHETHTRVLFAQLEKLRETWNNHPQDDGGDRVADDNDDDNYTHDTALQFNKPPLLPRFVVALFFFFPCTLPPPHPCRLLETKFDSNGCGCPALDRQRVVGGCGKHENKKKNDTSGTERCANSAWHAVLESTAIDSVSDRSFRAEGRAGNLSSN